MVVVVQSIMPNPTPPLYYYSQGATFPLKLRFRRQLVEDDVMKLEDIVSMENESLKLTQVKRRLMVVSERVVTCVII